MIMVSSIRSGLRRFESFRLRGFTLIELLVVVSIIALLIAILMPALGRARQSARKVACMSNVRQMGIACQEYLSEYDGHLPPSSCHITKPEDYWIFILGHYTQSELLFRCPAEKVDNFVDWDIPLSEQRDRRYSSFCVNQLLDPVCYRYGYKENRYNKVGNIKRPMDCIWIAEAPDKATFYLADHIHPESWEGALDNAKEYIAWDRHLGRSHYLFVDGHVGDLELEETYWIRDVVESGDSYRISGQCYWYPDSAPGWPGNL